MTPEERATVLASQDWCYFDSDFGPLQKTSGLQRAIAAAIRDAVVEAVKPWRDELEDLASNSATLSGHIYQAKARWSLAKLTNGEVQRSTALSQGIAEARAALEPFARLAARFDNANNPWFTWRDDNWLPWDAPLDRKFFTIGQLRAARDAYLALALGGKL